MCVCWLFVLRSFLPGWGQRIHLHVQMWYLHFKRLRSWHKILRVHGETEPVHNLIRAFGQFVYTIMNKHHTRSGAPTNHIHQPSTTLPIQVWLDTDCHGLTWVSKKHIQCFRKQMPYLKSRAFYTVLCMSKLGAEPDVCAGLRFRSVKVGILLQMTVSSPSTIAPALGSSSREKETAWMKGMRPWHSWRLGYGITGSNSWLCNCNQAFRFRLNLPGEPTTNCFSHLPTIKHTR